MSSNKDIFSHFSEIELLPSTHRAAFAASCSERLLPNYRAFTYMEKWGDPTPLQKGLDYVWASFSQNGYSEMHLRESIKACESVIPSGERFTSLFTSGAQNAAASIVYTMQCRLEEKPEYARYAASRAIDTIDAYLFAVNTPKFGPAILNSGFDEWLGQAPLLLAEVDKQKQTIRILRNQARLDQAFIEDLRRSSADVGIFPEKRGLLSPH